MKYRLLSFIVVLFAAQLTIAGGIVTNTNQSAEFIRSMNRNASTATDAVYFNPAGLTHLSEGLHFYLSNQTVFQTRTIRVNNPAYNNDTFEGETTAPLFPNVYVAYRKGDFAVSGGVAPVGGGGSAEFPGGLPSFETRFARLSAGIPASQLASDLSSFGIINGYDLEANFTGSSIYLGYQLGVSYALFNQISIAGGARYVSAMESYEGELQNIALYTTKNPMGSPPGILNEQVLGATFSDMEVDAKRTGTGVTIIGGIHLSPFKGLDIGVRYESLTKLNLINDTNVDDTKRFEEEGMFPDGKEVDADIPALAAAGISYQMNQHLRAETSFTYFFNTAVDWNGREEYVENGFEGGVALEYQFGDKLAVSAGVLVSRSGATDEYQSDLSYSLNSNSVGLGAQYALMPNLAVTAGVSNTLYEEGTNAFDFEEQRQTYEKTAIVYTVGVGYSL